MSTTREGSLSKRMGRSSVRQADTSGHAGDRQHADPWHFAAGSARPADNHSAIIEFLVDDVDAEYDRLTQFVADFVSEPTTMPWGNRSLLFRPPTATSSTSSHPSPRTPSPSSDPEPGKPNGQAARPRRRSENGGTAPEGHAQVCLNVGVSPAGEGRHRWRSTAFTSAPSVGSTVSCHSSRPSASGPPAVVPALTRGRTSPSTAAGPGRAGRAGAAQPAALVLHRPQAGDQLGLGLESLRPLQQPPQHLEVAGRAQPQPLPCCSSSGTVLRRAAGRCRSRSDTSPGTPTTRRAGAYRRLAGPT